MKTTTTNPKLVSKSILGIIKDEFLVLKIKTAFRRDSSKSAKIKDTMVSYSFYEYF